MDLKISLDDEVYNHFLNNEYSRADIIAVHTALNNAEPDRWDWIPISERLPKENKTVMVSTKYSVYPEARYTKEYGWEWAYEAGADYWAKLGGVTAWMPLPKKYEPQESSDDYYEDIIKNENIYVMDRQEESINNRLEDLSKRVETLENQMKEDREELLKKLQADLDYAKFRCALPTIQP